MKKISDNLKINVEVMDQEDVIVARQEIRQLMRGLGFSLMDQTRVVTAVSELARNIIVHAGQGRVEAYQVIDQHRIGISCIFTDEGPGIHDVQKALEPGFSTANSMGIGLGGAKNLCNEFDVLRARKYGAQISEKMGFREISQAEIDIVISELGTNIVKHSRAGGILVFRSITMGPIENGRLEIAAQNNDKTLGKGFEQVKENLEKNHSTTATLGIGLSGIRRMTDSFDLRLTQENKLEFIVSKLVDADLQSPVKVSVISRPILGERVSGDTYYSRQSRNEILFGVVDGLGHGPEAHKVAELSERIIDIHYLKPLGLIIEQLHRHLRQTRGAAVSLASIDFLQNQLSHISLGNIETRLYKRGKCEKLMTYNGTVGALIPRFKVMTYPFAKGDCVIMTSDGISDKYEVDSKTLLSVPQKMTHVIMSEFGRNHDDATVLVVK